MPWHAFTFDGLDAALADAEFAEQVSLSTAAAEQAVIPTSPGTGPGTITQVNTPLVNRFMETLTPHLQKAVSAGVTDAVNNTISTLKPEYKQKLLIGGIAAGSAAVLALLFLWKMSSRLQECCPARPMSGLGCSRPMDGCCG